MKWPLNFEEVFKISATASRLNHSHPNVTKTFSRILKIIYIYFVSSLSFMLLIYSIIFHNVKELQYTEAIKNGTMAIVAVTVTFKHIILIRARDSIENLIKVLNEDYNLAKNMLDEEKKIVLKYAKMGVNICKFWLAAGVLTGLMFPAKAFALMVYYCFKDDCKLVHMFDLHLPAPLDDVKDDLIMYFLLFVLCFSFDIFAASIYIGFDPIVPILILHTCGQLELIGRNVKKVLDDGNISHLNKRLKIINMKLVKIYRFIEVIQNIFVVLYEFNLKTTTFLIPFSAFQIVMALRNKEISLEFTFFFFGTILHFYFPCYYSNMLMEKNEELRQNIYACGWETETKIEIRKTILLMLTRTSVPLTLRTIFFPICLDTYAEMARQAYTIYNLMNAAWG